MRCLESAMIYYQRYHLHNEFDTGSYYDIALTALFITSKNEDTIKKLRDIIQIGNQIRNSVMKPELLDSYRKKILRLEFKLLETISFDFRSNHVEEYLVKIGKDLKVDKEVALLAWLIAIDSFQIDIGLKVPPHATAISCLIIASKLQGGVVKGELNVKPERYYTNSRSVNEALLDLLDLYIHHFNFTTLVGFFPDLKDQFLNIKLSYASARGFADQDAAVLEKDEYFKERDFSNGERRYMLGNQKKRLYNEI
jgi:CTD kinase subunit beta